MEGKHACGSEEAAREGLQAAIWSQLGTTIPVVLHARSGALPPGDGVVHTGIYSLLHGFAHPTWKVGQ